MESNVNLRKWLKLKIVLNRATNILRQQFLIRWQLANDGREWVSGKDSGIGFIRGLGKPAYEQAKEGFQKRVLQDGDVTLWDLSTLLLVLQWTTFPAIAKEDDKYLVEIQEIHRLTEVRDKVVRFPSKDVDETDFDTLWDEVVSALVALGDSQQELDQLKDSDNLAQIIPCSDVGDGANETADLLKEKGDELLRNGKCQEAVAEFTTALSLPGLSATQKATLYIRRSTAYLGLAATNPEPEGATSAEESENYGYRALCDAEQAVVLWPTWWQAYYRAGCAFTALDRMQKAVDYLDRALILEPDDAEVLEARHYAKMKLGQQARYEHLENRCLPSFEEFLTVTEEELPDLVQEYGDFVLDLYQAEKYRLGLGGCTVDYGLAAEYYKKVADEGLSCGLYNLAMLTKEGQGVKRDICLAIQLLKKAAKQTVRTDCSLKNMGICESQYTLGLFHQEGVGVAQDPVAAVSWYEKAIENGCSEAAHALGLMYMNGAGVPCDTTKGLRYMTLAATRGCPNAMVVLAWEDAKNGDLPRARDMFDRALDCGCGQAHVVIEEFDHYLEEQERKLKDVCVWEIANRVQAGSLSLEDRFQRMSLAPKTTEVEGGLSREFVKVLETLLAPAFRSDSRPVLDYGQLCDYASRGSVMAKFLLEAKESYLRGMIALIQPDESVSGSQRADLDSDVVRHLAKAVRMEGMVIDYTLELKDKLLVLIRRVLDAVGSSRNQTDIDARYCYIWLNLTPVRPALKFIKECCRKYGSEAGFRQIHSAIYSLTGQYEESLREMDACIQLATEPSSEMLYEHALALNMLTERIIHPDRAIEAFQKYLEHAPKDHRKVPEAHYAIAYLHLLKRESPTKRERLGARTGRRPRRQSDDVPPETLEHFDKGLESEKDQLPFFMPYESKNKFVLEQVFRARNISRTTIPVSLQAAGSSIAEEEESPQAGPSGVQQGAGPSGASPEAPHGAVARPSTTFRASLKNPLRVEAIKEFRKYLQHARFMEAFEGSKATVSYTPDTTHRAPKSMAGLRPIAFRDMNPRKECVYEGRVVLMTVIEELLARGPSITTLVQDENEDVQPLAVYNFEMMDNEQVVEQMFGIGCKLYLLNPYLRVANDGKTAMRVDDPSTVLPLGPGSRLKDMCRFCLAENSSKVCTNCKRAWYCSKQCQVNDWKLYKHKFICDKPGTY